MGKPMEFEAIKGIRWCWNSWPASNAHLVAVLEPSHLSPIRRRIKPIRSEEFGYLDFRFAYE
ncbi:hypothetical protein GBA52_001879 [Prunus armeniaca]|nr:hypothetical protein GBA52_001879 [Prunus armeniaca]